ncbi:hypothetical protein DM860_009095 [Cuscuta australis]|uniref:Cytochrome P450 n=1 Tax=Cuscuta australis TaxID=267555 RepID=A0A328DDD0_9ASTE|nr:hypothetical protein DM860_009095 [Cuscuta australis]
MDIFAAVLYALFLPLPIIIYYYLYTSRKKSPCLGKAALPEPSGSWPFVGHLPALGGANTLLHRALGAMADTHGPAFAIRLGSHRAVVISSQELVKECFTANDRVVATRPWSLATKIMGYDHAMFGFAPYGAYWRDMRKVAVVELLSHRQLDLQRPLHVAEIDALVKELYGTWVEKGGGGPVRVEMKEKMGDLMMNIGVRTIVGKRYGRDCGGRGGGAEEEEEESKRGKNAMAEFLHMAGQLFFSDFIPWLGWLDVINGSTRRMKKTAKELDEVLGNWVKSRRQHKIDGDADDHCTIDVMLSSFQANTNREVLPHGHIDTLIKANCLTLFLGATDTTVSTLIWALSHLLNDREALKKAQDELELHVGLHRQADPSDIPKLVYLNAVIKETLRLRPPAPLSGPREAMEDFTLSGFHVPAGTRLFVNLWKLHRDPKVWSHPSEFRPERFLTDHKSLDVRGRDFEFIPFSSGRRMCPGVSFAMQVLHLVLAKLLHGFELGTEMDSEVDMTESPGLVMPKATPLEVVLAPRLPPQCY